MRHPGKPLAQHPPLPADVEKQRFERHLRAISLDRACGEKFSVDRAPVAEIDLTDVDTRTLRLLDIGRGIEHLEIARQLEVARQRADEARRQPRLVVAAQVLEL